MGRGPSLSSVHLRAALTAVALGLLVVPLTQALIAAFTPTLVGVKGPSACHG